MSTHSLGAARAAPERPPSYRHGVEKLRLDALLAARGLYPSRTQAAAAVMAGQVRIGPGGHVAEKAGQLVPGDLEIAVMERPRYVSRGGIKLENALATLPVPVGGRQALDVGASTGGFTDCLLQHGAEHVVALDVAYGELDWSLRGDPRVTVLERVNARRLTDAELPYRPELIVCDVSFISLTKVLPAVLSCAADRHDVLAMVKPQFEVGRERVGRGGVVRDPAMRRAAVLEVASAIVARCGSAVLAATPSGLPGPKGNRETFLWLAEPGRSGALSADQLAARLMADDPDHGPGAGA